MTWFTTTVASALALSGMCSAHMILANPKPYGDPDNSPLTSSNYPCQISGDASTFYSTDGLSNTVAAGESLTMSFTGSAVHGGGSCQVALTTDMQPSKSTRWSVILSIEGGCPTKDGTTASTYDVKIPSDIAAGTYSYAWTWTSKLSGTQEYYMNCAPLTVTSGSSKRSADDISPRSDSLDSYPPLAVYNLAELNSCKSELSSSPLYPYPGSTVEHLAEGEPAYANITGTDCFASGVTYDGSSSGSTSSTTGNSDSGSDSSSSGSETTSQAAEATTAATTAGAAATSSASGFLTSVVAATSSAAAAATTQAATSAAAAAPTAAASGSSSSSSSSSGSSSGSCTAGDYQCLSGGKTYKMCVAGGTWSTTMSVADGTACTPGTDSTLSLTVTSARKQRRRNGMPLLSFR